MQCKTLRFSASAWLCRFALYLTIAIAFSVSVASGASSEEALIIWQQLPETDWPPRGMGSSRLSGNDWVGDGRAAACFRWWTKSGAPTLADIQVWRGNPPEIGPVERVASWDAVTLTAVESDLAHLLWEYNFSPPSPLPTVSGQSYWFLIDWAGLTPSWVASPSVEEQSSGFFLSRGWQPFSSTPPWAPADYSLQVMAVPEPSTFALLAMAATGLSAYAWRRRR